MQPRWCETVLCERRGLVHVECGWTQERIAQKVGKKKTWVCYRLRFGAFLAFTSGERIKFSTENLTERRFRSCWARTKGKEAARFEQVVKLLSDDVPSNCSSLPSTSPHPLSLSRRPAYRAAAVRGGHEVGLRGLLFSPGGRL
jgi:hypothetical protein